MESESVLEWEDNTANIPFLKHMLAGSVAGCVEHVAIFPVDTIKTHLQVDVRGTGSAVNFAKNLWAQEGLTSFWTGSRATMMGCVPAHAAYFSVYEYSKKYFNIEANSSLYFLSTLITGAAASFFHDFFMTPMEVIKQRNQLSRESGVLRTAQEIMRMEGTIALYRSLPVNYIMNVPHAGIFITVFENLKSVFLGEGPYTIPQVFTCAAIAGCAASAITTPLDVIKTRMNTQTICPKYLEMPNPGTKAEQVKVKYSNIISTAKCLFKNEGFNGFSRGAIARMAQTVPSAAISWATYEYVKNLILQRNWIKII